MSTTSIDLTPISGQSVIDARGGSGTSVSGTNAGTTGGGGSGGSIHLIAPSIPHFGDLLDARGARSSIGGNPTIAGDGYIRISTNTINPLGAALPAAIFGPLFAPPLPTATPLPAVRIVSVNNVNAPSNPQGNYLLPDVQINSGTAVNVAIAASNIPLGTVVRLRLASEVSDSIIDCAGLAGSIASSTAICSATFPFSVSIANLRASW